MTTEERRRFSRIRYCGAARFLLDGAAFRCELSDLSLKGALVRAAGILATGTGQACALELVLDDGETTVRMQGTVAHVGKGEIGMVCREIDLDSLIHLRRLLALNLGDAALLERELPALLADAPDA